MLGTWRNLQQFLNSSLIVISKIDLLVRVRYTNPLPPPPFPPKLIQTPTLLSRYARLEFTAGLAGVTPFPMVVDAECGMPLDLARWESIWDGPMGDDDPGTVSAFILFHKSAISINVQRSTPTRILSPFLTRKTKRCWPSYLQRPLSRMGMAHQGSPPNLVLLLRQPLDMCHGFEKQST